MKDQKHSTILELKGFSDGTLAGSESERIGKHLLHCPECRRLMPLPSKERLWATIMSEWEVNEILARSEGEASGSSLSGISSFLRLESGLLWGGAMLLIFLSFTFLLWLNPVIPDREVVQTFEKELGADQNFPDSIDTLSNVRKVSPKDADKTTLIPKSRPGKTEVKTKTAQNDLPQNKTEIRNKEQFSLTRGGAVKCREENFGLEFTAEKENFVFKWKKVQNAAKYHLYISDEDEILIDEYETEAETTFVLKKRLNPLKTYLWKIIVTLENGKKMIGASQKFTLKNFQTNQKQIETKRGSDTRCSANG